LFPSFCSEVKEKKGATAEEKAAAETDNCRLELAAIWLTELMGEPNINMIKKHENDIRYY